MFMKKLQKIFGVTEAGAHGIVRASVWSAISNVAYILPMFLIMFFLQEFFDGRLHSISAYIAAIVIFALLMYIVIYVNYNTLYTTTFSECKDLRIEIANTMKDLPLSYFSKHDTSDAAQTVMADTAAIEHAISHAIPQTIGLSFYLFVIAALMIAMQPTLGVCVFAPIAVSVVLYLLSKKIIQ